MGQASNNPNSKCHNFGWWFPLQTSVKIKPSLTKWKADFLHDGTHRNTHTCTHTNKNKGRAFLFFVKEVPSTCTHMLCIPYIRYSTYGQRHWHWNSICVGIHKCICLCMSARIHVCTVCGWECLVWRLHLFICVYAWMHVTACMPKCIFHIPMHMCMCLCVRACFFV